MVIAQQAVKFAKNFAKVTACSVMCAWALTACEKLNSPKPTQPTPENQTAPTNTETANGTLSRAIYATAFQLDPHQVKESSEAAPLRDLLVGLVAFNPKGEVVPAVAQNWFSEDQKSWLFVLDDKAKWSNGEAVTAQDFVASWQRLVAPQNHSPLAKYAVYLDLENAKAIQDASKPIETLGVAALNAHTLQIRLNRPNPQLPQMLAHTALLPTYHGEVPDAAHFISNGAYRIAQMSPTKLQLRAEDPATPFQTVTYELVTAAQDVRTFDVVENPRLSQTAAVVKFPQRCAYYYEFNFADPQLSKKPVREALRAMISSARIGAEYGIPSQSVIPHHLLKDREKQWAPIMVEQLLTQAGVTPANPLTLTLLYDEGVLHSAVANQLTRTLSQSELFHINLQQVDWATLMQKKAEKNYQMVRAGWCADYADPAIFLQKFHSQSPDNQSGYHNAQVDKKLAQLQTGTLSKEARLQLVSEINDLLYDDVAVLPLFQYQYRVGIASSLLGIDLNNDSEVIYSKDLKRISTEKDTQ